VPPRQIDYGEGYAIGATLHGDRPTSDFMAATLHIGIERGKQKAIAPGQS